MLKRFVVAAAFIGWSAQAADAPWATLGSCLTPQGTLCRTVEWKSAGWENVSWGFHAIRRWNATALLAYSHNGSMMERYSQENYRNWFVRDGGWDQTRLTRAADYRSIEIDNVRKHYRTIDGALRGWPIWDSTDANCLKMAEAFGLSGLKRDGQDSIAGFSTIRYTGSRPPNGKQSVWLAPSLGCSQMRVVIERRNSIGLPISYSRQEVVRFEIGEPEERLFAMPVGYRETR